MLKFSVLSSVIDDVKQLFIFVVMIYVLKFNLPTLIWLL